MAEPSDGGAGPWSAALARAHAAWPSDWMPPVTFIEHLRARLPAERDPAEAVNELAVEDLYLAFACALGVTPAIEAFTRDFLGEVDAHVARFDGSSAFKDEVRQVLATRLLVAEPGATPTIADYAGRAPLSAWLRVAAIRAALNLLRGTTNDDAERAAEREVTELADAADLELDVIRARYRPIFEAAITRALAALPVRDRTILRLRLVEGVEVDRIATMYGVHRTTVTRWLADSRTTLFNDIRRILIDELGATDTEFDSLVGLVRSHLHVSLVRLLRER